MRVQPIQAHVLLPSAHRPEAGPAARTDTTSRTVAPTADSETVRRAIELSNRTLPTNASELTFEFDEAAGRVVVRLVDRSTREVLRQIPTEQVLAIARALQERLLRGAIVRADA